MTELTIRRVGKEAADILSAIHKECFPNYWNIESFNDFSSSSDTLLLMAYMPDPVGMMVCRRLYPDEAEIITLAVRSAFRRQGIARALLEKAMEMSLAAGAAHMFLDVEDGNSAAVKLYEAYGFSLINRRKQYYRQTDGSYTDALVMRGKL